MGWQELITLTLTGVSSVYLAWRGWQSMRGRKQGGCGSCDSCPTSPQHQAASKTFVPLEQLWKR